MAALPNPPGGAATAFVARRGRLRAGRRDLTGKQGLVGLAGAAGGAGKDWEQSACGALPCRSACGALPCRSACGALPCRSACGAALPERV
ncbi:MAG: hypothetical protein ACYDB7_14260, partial [Mycobacteriales bacterium]